MTGTAAGRTALDDIAAERQRQIEAEGYDAAHDDQHTDGSIAKAAACYALGRIISGRGTLNARTRKWIGAWTMWPWDMKWWKPKSRRENLVRAGALIVAEIERIDRAAAKPTGAA